MCVAGVCFVEASGACSGAGSQAECPTGSRCWDVQEGVPVCWSDCAVRSCAGACDADGSCAANDASNVTCDNSCAARCLAAPEPTGDPLEVGDAPPLPTASCADIPSFECTVAGGTVDQIEAFCGELVVFDPRQGDGYDDYPINGETAANQYRSFIRRDVMMLVRYATAQTRCIATNFGYGDSVLGLGDMSEEDGRLPGSAEGQPGHPPECHERGYDMDIGYYQLEAPNNRLREVCPHTENGQEAYHCTGAPTSLDIWRTTIFIAKLMDSPQYLTAAVDGEIAPFVRESAQKLCDAGHLDASSKACGASGLARGPQMGFGNGFSYETVEQGNLGWYLFHHHHLHLSVFDTKGGYLPNW